MPNARPFSTSLEEKARQLGWTPERFREWLRAQGYTDTDIEEAFSPTALRAIVEPSVKRLTPRAAAELGWPPSQLESRITMEVENADTVECHVELPAKAAGKHMLSVPAGFLFFANKVVRAVANGLLKGQGPPIPRAEEEAAMLLRAYYGHHKPLQQAWAIQPYQLGTQQQYLIAFLSGHIREAVVAHELGHIVYDLGRKTNPTVEKLREALVPLLGGSIKKRWIDRVPLLNRGGKRERWIEEVAADFLALQFLGRPEGDETAPCHGLMVLLFIIEMLELCSGRDVYARGSHPPSSARRGFLLISFPWLAKNPALAAVDTTCRHIVRLAEC